MERGLFINFDYLVFCYDSVAVSRVSAVRDAKLILYRLGPMILNHHRADEPFPVKVALRSEKHANLIIDEATKSDVLDDSTNEI